MQNQVHVLFEGYSYEDPQDTGSVRANCSCTLIKTISGLNIIVDTMTAWDGEQIEEALKKHDLHPKDINIVVCTHGHSDHIGCNYLFKEAKWHFIGSCQSHHDRFFIDSSEEEKFELDGSNVIVEKTPGHTLTCVSVIVQNTQLGGTVGICGDLFERQEDINDSSIWLGAGSQNNDSQKEQRLRMAKICDYIIPGHGKGFAVTEEMRCALQKEFDMIELTKIATSPSPTAQKTFF